MDSLEPRVMFEPLVDGAVQRHTACITQARYGRPFPQSPYEREDRNFKGMLDGAREIGIRVSEVWPAARVIEQSRDRVLEHKAGPGNREEVAVQEPKFTVRRQPP
jgi:hypothetical protein